MFHTILNSFPLKKNLNYQFTNTNNQKQNQMAKVQLKGFLESMTKIETFSNKSGNGETKVCRLRIFVPGYTNSFGDKVGTDSIFEVRVMNSRIESLPEGIREAIKNLTESDAKVIERQKVSLEAYLDSRFVDGDKPFYAMELSLNKLELIS